MTSASDQLTTPGSGSTLGMFDILGIPRIGAALRHRYGRLILQVPLLLILLLVIYDGLSGPQLAPANNATVLAWVHYRGFVIIGLLAFGNIFCMGCPFTLPRTLAHRLSRWGRRWPRLLRNKWISIFSLVIIFWLYEWLDIWASPWLTAWLAIAYLVLAFVLEAVFSESAFCKYVCPLGAFNFTYSGISPFQITAREPGICRSCAGKECVNGSAQVLGCGTELFVPAIQSNMDCTFCLDCARACPYDNVGLTIRSPLKESSGIRWPRSWALTMMIVCLTYMGLMNAFGMVSPVYALLDWLEAAFDIHSEGVLLGIIFLLGDLLIPISVTLLAAWISSRISGDHTPGVLKEYAARYGPAFIPLGFGIWLAHYGFHFAIGGLSIIPVFQSFLLDHGIKLLGTQPNWELSFLIPTDWIFPLQLMAILAGFGVGLYATARISLHGGKLPIKALGELLPWALIITTLVFLSLAVFNLPMEMRGTRLIGI